MTAIVESRPRRRRDDCSGARPGHDGAPEPRRAARAPRPRRVRGLRRARARASTRRRARARRGRCGSPGRASAWSWSAAASTPPVLAEALRAGVREVVEERDLAGLSSAVRRTARSPQPVRQQVADGGASARPSRRGRVITVFSAKGGCGKTTLATNIAAALADRGRARGLPGRPRPGLRRRGDHAAAVPGAHHRRRRRAGRPAGRAGACASLLTPHSPGPGHAAGAGRAGRGRDGSRPALVGRRSCDPAGACSTSSSWTPRPRSPTTCSPRSTRRDVHRPAGHAGHPGAEEPRLTLETLDLLELPARAPGCVVLNRADAKVGLALDRGREDAPGRRSSAHIPSSRDVPASINRGVPIVLDDPQHPVSKAIRELRRRLRRRAGRSDRPAIPARCAAAGAACSPQGGATMSLAERLAQARRARAVDRRARSRRPPRVAHDAADRRPAGRDQARRCTRRCRRSSGRSSTTRGSTEAELEQRVRQTLQEVLAQEETPLTVGRPRPDRRRRSADEILGHGPLEPFLRDPDITEIMVNGPDQIYVERCGRIYAGRRGASSTRSTCAGPSTRSSARVGRRVDEAQPDGRRPPARRQPHQRGASRRWPSTAPC